MPRQPSRRELLAQVNAGAPPQGASAVRLNIAIAHQLGMPAAG